MAEQLVRSFPKRHPLPAYETLPPIIRLPVPPIEPGPGAFPTRLEALRPTSETPDERYWSSLRSQFDLVSGLTFFNSGTYAPQPRVVLEAHKRWARHLAANPDDYQNAALVEETRAATARFINAAPDDIALTRSTTEGINLLVHGLDWQAGDEIILDRNDHFTAFMSFLTLTGRHGVKLVFVDMGENPRTEDDIIRLYAEKITPRTKLLFLNWVSYRSGRKLPIRALAKLGRAHDLIISVDAAQAFGAVPVDVQELDIDHLVAPSHKWIFAGPGAGMTYFNPRIIESIWPVAGPGVETASSSYRKRTARQLDDHNPRNIPTLAAFLEALKFQEVVGSTTIINRLFYLSDLIRNKLEDVPWGSVITPRERSESSALTSFHVGDGRNADDIANRLFDTFGIKVNSELFVGLNAIRISPHLFTSPAQINYLVDALKTL